MNIILITSCPDKPGIAEKIAHFISKIGGNITDTNQHKESDLFISRIAFEIKNEVLSKEEIKKSWEKVAKELETNSEIYFDDEKIKIGILVSKEDHCLLDILWRIKQKELNVEIAFIMSNHDLLKKIAESENIPFYYTPIEENKSHEKIQLDIIKKNDIQLLIMAKYMQILSADFINTAKIPIINIHHSSLPDFPGAQPYKKAYERGVKQIGATAHYANQNIDEGPIIEQDFIRVTHKDSPQDFTRKGRDLEKIVLARAIKLHTEHKILVYKNRTAIFN